MSTLCHRKSGGTVAGRQQAGLSLIELMIAITLGVMLVLGMVEVFGTTRAAYQTASSLSRLQEGGRFAMEFIRGDLRMGGQWGCFNEYAAQRKVHNHLSTTFVNTGSEFRPVETGAAWPYRTDLPIEGFEYEDSAPGDTVTLAVPPARVDAVSKWSPSLPGAMAGIIGEAVVGSDVIAVRYAEAQYVPIVGSNLAAGMLSVGAGDAGFIEQGGVYVVTDCKDMSLLQVNTAPAITDALPAGGGVEAVFTSTVGGVSLNQAYLGDFATYPWTENYVGPDFSTGVAAGEGAPIHRYRMAVYYVGLPAGETVPALYRREVMLTGGMDQLGPSQRLIDGVESLQVAYGASFAVGSSGRLSDLQGARPTEYMTADELTGGENDNTTAAYVNAFRRAKKVRASLLLRGSVPASVQGGDVAYNVGGVMFNSPTGDTNLRSVYETIVSVRNRY